MFGYTKGATLKNIKINGTVSGKSCVGGIVGSASDNTRIDNCYVPGSVTITGTDENVGGVVGLLDKSTVSNCRVEAKVTSGKAPSTEVEDGNYIIYTALNERKSIDIEDGIHSVNVQGKWAHLWENGEANVFAITKDKDTGTYTIKSTVTGLMLDVDNASKANGAKVQQWESNTSDAQRWTFKPAGEDGYYYIRCEGGQYLEVKNSATDNGTKIVSSAYTGKNNQKFKLVNTVGNTTISTGGIVGSTATNGKIINCVFIGALTGVKAVGGILGSAMYGDPEIVNCSSGGYTAEYKNTKTSGYEHGGLVGFISSSVNTMKISNCFTICAVGITKDSGIIIGNNQKADKVFAELIRYKESNGAPVAISTGYKLIEDAKEPIKKLTSLRSTYLNPLSNYASGKTVDGIALTSWENDSGVAVPRSYVEVSSFVASVFSAQNLPILIVIVIGLVAGIVGVTVMYRKKKKKSSMIKQ